MNRLRLRLSLSFLPLLAVSLLAFAGSSPAQTLYLSDPFTFTGTVNSTDLNVNLPGRQTGTLAGSTYSEEFTQPAGYTNDVFLEKRSASFAASDALLLRTYHSTGGSSSAAQIATDFGPQVAGKKWRVSFTGNLQRNSTDITDTWLGISLGDTTTVGGPSLAASDFGLLVKGDGGWTTYSDAATLGTGAAAALKAGGIYATNLTVTVTVDETVSPITASAVVSVTGGSTFTLGTWNITWENASRYLELRVFNTGNANSPGTLTDARFDSLSVADFAAPPTITEISPTQNLWVGDSTTLSATTVSGTTPTYQWSKDGSPVGGATSSTLALSSVAISGAGTYTVTATNSNGSTTSSTVVNVVYPNRWQRTAEPLAVSSKRTPLIFSEIMYHPATQVDGRNLEFIELYNTNPWPEDLTGWRISNDVDFAFPAGTTIPGLGFLVIAAVPADVQATYGISGVLGPWTGSLSNQGGTLRLRRANDSIVLEANWNDGPDWPAAADGAGHSLVLARPSYGEGDVRAWSASAVMGGSPGAADAVPASAQDQVVINEIVAHSTVGTDFIELFNNSPISVDVSGCWISDDPAVLNKFQIPAGTTMTGRARLAFTQTQLGFALSAEGETLYFSNPALTRVLDAVRFRGQLPDTASGHYPDGEGAFRRLSTATAGATNAVPARGPVVINELYFHPITNDDEEEWIELRNLTGSPVSLEGWQVSDGVSFTFPAGATIAANGYVVVAKNPTRIKTNHPSLSASIVFGPFSGSLSDTGEEVVLRQPVTPLGGLTYFAAVDEVDYRDQSRWSKWADGGGSSLELSDARGTGTPLWLDSDETSKAPWTSVSVTGVIDNLNSNASALANRLDALLLNAGEALVDEVTATQSGGANLVTNGGFESDLTGWSVQGTHNTSFISTSPFAGSKSLRLVALGRGDTMPNHARTSLTATVTTGSTATLSAQVRWLRGSYDFLLRLRGGGLEAYGKLTVPTNLGTPGAANSRSLANAAPAVTDVIHRPVLPAANVPFRVFARVSDPDAISTVVLKYRIDPSATINSVTMLDNGNGGDLLPGDGIFTGTIPAQASGALIGFTVTATDASAASAVFPPTGECLARVGDVLPPGAFGAYSMWITSSTLSAWSARLIKSNEAFPITFLHNNTRVFYGTGAHFAQFADPTNNNPTTALIGYDIDLPLGEPLLGESEVVLDYPIRDPTNQREQLMHWMLEQMNLPALYRRDIHLMVNGVRRAGSLPTAGAIYHDCFQPGGGFLDSNFPGDPNGHLIKTSRWDEINDANNGVLAGPLNALNAYTTTGGAYKVAAYRWCWLPRSSTNSENDFADFLNLVTAANVSSSTAAYVSAVQSVVDVDQWMANFAFADLVCYWDTFGNFNAKNAYLYKPTLDRWKVITNDLDVGLGADNTSHVSPPAGATPYPLFETIGDTKVQKMYDTPALVRPYYRALSKALATFFTPSAVTTRITQHYEGFLNSGIDVASPLVPSGIYMTSNPSWATIPGFITARTGYIQSQLTAVTPAFSVNGSTTVTTNSSPITVTGVAPVTVKTITFNDLELPITWTSVTAWSASVNVASGTNPLVIRAFDDTGALTASVTLTVTYNGTTAWPALKINEWMADNSALVLDPADGHSDDWFELYNPTGSAVSLTNWSIGDSAPTATSFVIPAGYTIPAGGRLLIWADDETIQNTGSGQLHVPFKLSASGETLTLRAPDGSVVDTVTFGSQVNNISQGRVPDGGATIDFLSSASAGTANGSAVAAPKGTASLSAGVVSFTVTSTAGFSYQAQYKNDLLEVAWTNLGTATKATGPTVTFTDSPGAQTQRFYRAVRTP